MKFDLVRLGDWFNLQKGISYTSANLVDESEIGLLTINAFITGGGYKQNSEKPFKGEIPEAFTLKSGDVLLAMTEQDSGLLASPLVVNVEETGFQSLTFSLDVARLVPKSLDFDPRFVFNLLRIPAFRIRASYGDTGSTVQRLPYEALGDFMIPKPPLSTQLAVIEIMATIDEKIRVNQETATTLEAIVEVLFRSWFVDFDPVHAKARGEIPEGVDSEIAALFPNRFNDCELGLIPSGWTVGQLSDFFKLTMGQSPKGNSYNSDGVGLPFYQGRTDFGARFPSRRVFSTSGSRVAERGDTLVSVRAPVGDSNQATELCIIGRGVAALRHKSGSEVYTHSLIKTLSRTFEFYNGEGTVFGSINRKDFEAIQLVEPSDEIVSKFDTIAGPMNAQIRNLFDESQTLTELRDSLLPRLVSGEILIPEELLGE